MRPVVSGTAHRSWWKIINATLPCQAILHENKDKEELAQAISESALLLNATSVGMAPDDRRVHY